MVATSSPSDTPPVSPAPPPNDDYFSVIGSRPAYKIRDICLARHIIFRDVIGNKRPIGKINTDRSDALTDFIKCFVGEANKLPINGAFYFSAPICIDISNNTAPTDTHDDNTYIKNIPSSFKSSNQTHTIYFGAVIIQNLKWDFRLRLDCHQEYTTLTFLLDNCMEAIDKINNNELHYDDLYNNIWNIMDGNLLQSSRSDPPGCGWKHELLEKLSGNKEEAGANRTTALSKRIIEFKGYSRHIYDNKTYVFKPSIPPFPEVDYYIKNRKNDGVISNLLISHIKKHHELYYDIIGGPAKDVVSPWEDRNTILCGMLGGAAIYGSNLGRKSRDPAGIAADVHYFVVYDGPSAEQLGRLMRLLHVLGELRHAALFDSNDLRLAGIELRQMGQLWGDGIRYADHESKDDSRKTFEELNFCSTFCESPFYETYGDEFYIHYRDEFNQWRFRGLTELCHGDLSFRLGRSAFYADTFRKRVYDLRCVRIDGLQSYDDFMRRNVEYYFDRSESIARRFHSAQGAMRYINERRIAKGDEHRQKTGKLLGVVGIIFGIFTAGTSIRDYLFPMDSVLTLYTSFLNLCDNNKYNNCTNIHNNLNYDIIFSLIICILFLILFILSSFTLLLLSKSIHDRFISTHIKNIARKSVKFPPRSTIDKERTANDKPAQYTLWESFLNWWIGFDGSKIHKCSTNQPGKTD